MKKTIIITILTLFALSSGVRSQDTVAMSVKDIAPAFGLQARFLDDTVVVAQYLDSLAESSQVLTDTCVTFNARVLALQNVMLHDYRHVGDSVWMDRSHYLMDYDYYRQKLNDLSSYLLRRAYSFIEQEHYRKGVAQQNTFNSCKDTINRLHRTIVNACEGFGISDSERKKELKEIYYAYLSVYNRYDFSKSEVNDAYIDGLSEFIRFQNHLIENLIGTGSYRNRIKNFVNTLRIKCGHAHSDVLRSYQRVSSAPSSPISFSSIDGYYDYIDSLQRVLHVQDCYLTVVDLRDKITANSDRINRLYGSRFRQVVKTYQEVAGSVNEVPAFTTQANADAFIERMQEFVKVQDCYLQDYNRLSLIKEHGDSIDSRCSIRYADVSKAYNKMVDDLYPKSKTPKPAYRSLDDAVRFSIELDQFETLQRQYDTVIYLRREIDRLKDSISRGWMSYMMINNGYQTIRKQVVLTPSFISVPEGSRFISELKDFLETEVKCIQAIRLIDEYRSLDNALAPLIQPYRNLRKAYSRLEKAYITIKAINHTSEVYTYCRQLEAFISVQNGIMEKAKSNDAASIDALLWNVTDIDKIENIIGI